MPNRVGYGDMWYSVVLMLDTKAMEGSHTDPEPIAPEYSQASPAIIWASQGFFLLYIKRQFNNKKSSKYFL